MGKYCGWLLTRLRCRPGLQELAVRRQQPAEQQQSHQAAPAEAPTGSRVRGGRDTLQPSILGLRWELPLTVALRCLPLTSVQDVGMDAADPYRF